MAPSIVKRSPELLIAMSSRIRHLLFSVPADIHPLAYSIIGFSRLLAAAVVCFLLGRLAGDRVFRWFDTQAGGERPAVLRWMEAGVERAAWLLVIVFPGSNIVAFLVGRRQMGTATFIPLVSAGIAIRLTWVWFAAKRYEDELKSALDFIDRYQLPLIIVLFVLTMIPNARKAYKQEASRRDSE